MHLKILESRKDYSERGHVEGLIMLDSVEEVCLKIRFLLDEAVKNNLTEGILLSGGLDTSILAVVASRFTSLKAVTVRYC